MLDMKAGPYFPPPMDPEYHVAIGWIPEIDGERDGYWFSVFEGEELIRGVGDQAELPYLVDLVEKSIAFIEWNTPEAKKILEIMEATIISDRQPRVRELLRYRAA